MRRYLCTIEEVEENKQRTKRRRIDPTLNENEDSAGCSGVQQQWINQRQQHVAVEPRTIQNTRRGKNMRLDHPSEQVAEYLKKQIRRSNHLLAQLEVDNEEKNKNFEEIENEDSEEDLEFSDIDDKDNEEEYFYSEITNNKSVESKSNTTLDGCGKPNSEMLEIMARRQQKLAQKNGQGQRIPHQQELSSLATTVVRHAATQDYSEPMEVDIVPKGRRSIRQNPSKFDKPTLGSFATATVGQTSTQKHSEPVDVDIVPRARKSIREKLNSSVSQDTGKLTPAMQEILARKQQASKLGPTTKKLDETVSSTTASVSNISLCNQQIEKRPRLGRKSIRNNKSCATSSAELSQQTEDIAPKRGRSNSVQQPDTTVHVTEKELKIHNQSINKPKCETEDIGKLTPAMQEILARKQEKTASKQGQNKKLDQTVSSTTENIAVVKLEQLSPKVTLEYSRSLEMETKTTTTYSTNITEDTDKSTSGMQKVLIQKQQPVASKPRKSRKLYQTITSTVETSPAKLVPVQSHIDAETKTRRKSTRQPQPNVSGTGDSLYHKSQEENKELQKRQKLNQLDSDVSESTSKMTPAMKEILVRKQQKEVLAKQGANKKLNQTVTSTTEPVLNPSADQSSVQLNLPKKKPSANETKSGGRSTRKSQAEKSTLEDVDDSTEEKQQILNEPVKKSKGKKANQTVSSTVQYSLPEPEEEGTRPRGKRTRKVVPDVCSTKADESSVNVESKTVSARGKRRTTGALFEESNENTEIKLNNMPQIKKGKKIEKETTKKGKKSIARSEDLNTTQNVENPTPAMQQLLAKKQQCALEKTAKGKK